MKMAVTYHWLPAEAIQFLKDNVVYETRMKTDRIGTLTEVEIPCRRRIGNYGTFHTQELHEYNLKDGSVAKEFVQKTVEVTEFHYFIGLYHQDQTISWPEEIFDKIK